ncbi:MAG: site-specific integrase [Chloroflexi bacterium]|nr:site-specific integrase [Chloroflexota bacterium]
MTKKSGGDINDYVRHEYPIIKREQNGYYYFYYDRMKRVSLGVRDEATAIKIYNIKKEEYLNHLKENILFISKKKGEYTLDEYKKLYLKLANQWKRPETIRIDELILNKLCGYEYPVPDSEVKVKVGSLIVDSVKRFSLIIASFHEKLLETCTHVSLNVYIRHLKSIFQYGVDHEYLTKNPYAKIKQSRVQWEPPRVLSDKEITKILNVQENKDKGFRPDPEFLLMIEAYLHTGCRCSELINLIRKEDVKPDHIVIRNTKTGRFRIVDLNEQAKKVFQRITKRGKRLFPRWRPQTVSHMFLEYARMAGINDVHLHDLRHTYASRCLEARMSLATVQVLMGHESINTTIKFYGHLSREHIKLEIEKLSYGYTQQTQQMKVVSNEDD